MIEDRKILLLSMFEVGKSASQCARELGVSRQRIHQLIERFGINYGKYKRRLAETRERKWKEKRKRLCQWCNKPFIVKQDGARVKFCSGECLREWEKAWRRVWQKMYFQTKKGREYKRQAWRKQYQRRDWSAARICLACQQKFAPRILYPNMKYCSLECYRTRKSAIDKT